MQFAPGPAYAGSSDVKCMPVNTRSGRSRPARTMSSPPTNSPHSALGRGAIAHRLAIGRWQRLHNGVYLIGSAPATAMARARAAIYACGEDAVLSHHTAAALHDLIPADEAAEVHVTVAGRNPGTRDGLIVHRVAELPPDERAIRHELPVTSAARTVCDIAATAGPREIERLLAEGRVQAWCATAICFGRSIECPTRRGSSVLRALLRPSVSPATRAQRPSVGCSSSRAPPACRVQC